MSTIVLPVRVDVDSFRYRINLDNQTWDIQISWNVRDERWFFYLRDPDNNLIGQAPLKLNDQLIYPYRPLGGPPGAFALLDPSGGAEECGREELGTRCKFVYIEGEDLEA